MSYVISLFIHFNATLICDKKNWKGWKKGNSSTEYLISCGQLYNVLYKRYCVVLLFSEIKI